MTFKDVFISSLCYLICSTLTFITIDHYNWDDNQNKKQFNCLLVLRHKAKKFEILQLIINWKLTKFNSWLMFRKASRSLIVTFKKNREHILHLNTYTYVFSVHIHIVFFFIRNIFYSFFLADPNFLLPIYLCVLLL